MDRILTADIGGTNSRFAAFRTSGDGRLVMEESIWLKTADADSFEKLFDNLHRSAFRLKPDACSAIVAAVPGPVDGGVSARLSNVPWTVDITPYRKKIGDGKVFLINDFVAQAYACRTEAVSTAVEVLPGQPQRTAPMAVIGAGTGLGACSLAADGHGGFIPFASETGHIAFAFVSEEENKFNQFLLRETNLPYVYTEVVVSGSGLSWLYQYFHGQKLSPWEVVAHLDIRAQVTQWFARFYARACRNYALTVLPRAGLYMAGGVASKNRFLVLNDVFREEFVASPIHHELLKQIPVSLITNEESGLWGAAFYGLTAIGKPLRLPTG